MLTKKLISLLAVSLLACVSAHAAPVSVSPTTQSVNVGSTFTLDVDISELGAGSAPSLGVFDFDLGFDTTRLAFQSAVYGTGLDVLGLGSLQTTTPGAGTVNLFELSLDTIADLDSLQADAFRIVTLTFQALAAGDTSFTLSANAFGDAAGDALPVTFGAPASVTLVGDTTGGTAPEPASLAILALGLLGVALARKFQRPFP
jgi:PEP-CTERM motif